MPAYVHIPSVCAYPAHSTPVLTNTTPNWEVGRFKKSDRITEGMKKMRAYVKHNLGGQPYLDIKHKRMNHWLKMTVLKHSDELVHPGSCTTAKWKDLSADTRCRLYRSLTKYMPWLVCFEGNWAADFFLREHLRYRRTNERRRPAVGNDYDSDAIGVEDDSPVNQHSAPTPEYQSVQEETHHSPSRIEDPPTPTGPHSPSTPLGIEGVQTQDTQELLDSLNRYLKDTLA